ncbi:hepatitis A virus cellular receptor 1 homolog isoform X1 [Larimichthys crocea]|uniref:hepatitis A virus cellular receptor 1 homolog isoform X1 n=2 Tax=Larimichthys crocea TaxID=215358 RepID=UPI000F5DA410|nr:hepatitis A virus cellular receptor 1 homolog isoform X1 [Larimichthys crocea]
MRGLCCFFLLILTQVSFSTVKVVGFFGDNVTLPCSYDTQIHGTLDFCWGRGKLPLSKCSNTILSEQGGMLFRQFSRYQLLGGVKKGNVSLTILNAQWDDAGKYSCRIEIPGWLNDQKFNIDLVIEEAPMQQPVTQETREILTSMSERIPTTMEKILRLEDIGRMAAIFLVTTIIILAYIFRRGCMLRGTLQHPNISTDENIYESIPIPE